MVSRKMTKDSPQAVITVSRQRLWEALTVLGFPLACGFELMRHPLWRDEMQPWLFARGSDSIAALVRNMHYETHPRLWYLILYVISRFTANPVAMQAANFVIIGAAITIFVRFCPLPLYLKAPTVFGYFMLCEWGAVSRNYALGMMFLFAFCARFPKRDGGWLGLAVLLFLAIQSNLFAAGLATVLAGLLVLEAFVNPRVWTRIRTRKMDVALSLSLVLGGDLLAFWTAIPKPDIDPSLNFLGVTASLWDKILMAIGAPLDGFYPWFWATPVLTNFVLDPLNGTIVRPLVDGFFGSRELCALAGLLLIPLTIAFFRRSRLISWTYPAGLVLLVVFAYIRFDDQLRYEGHFFLWFLICLWLAHYLPGSSTTASIKPFKLSTRQKQLYCSFVFIQLLDSVVFTVASFYHPYSYSKAVANYIKENHLENIPLVAYPDYAGMPVSGYLNKPVYDLDTQRWGTFTIENNKRKTGWKVQTVLAAVDEFAAAGNQDFLLLLDKPLAGKRNNQIYYISQVGNIREIQSFRTAIVYGESYWLYRYTIPELTKP